MHTFPLYLKLRHRNAHKHCNSGYMLDLSNIRVISDRQTQTLSLAGHFKNEPAFQHQAEQMMRSVVILCPLQFFSTIDDVKVGCTAPQYCFPAMFLHHNSSSNNVPFLNRTGRSSRVRWHQWARIRCKSCRACNTWLARNRRRSDSNPYYEFYCCCCSSLN